MFLISKVAGTVILIFFFSFYFSHKKLSSKSLFFDSSEKPSSKSIRNSELTNLDRNTLFNESQCTIQI